MHVCVWVYEDWLVKKHIYHKTYHLKRNRLVNRKYHYHEKGFDIIYTIHSSPLNAGIRKTKKKKKKYLNRQGYYEQYFIFLFIHFSFFLEKKKNLSTVTELLLSCHFSASFIFFSYKSNCRFCIMKNRLFRTVKNNFPLTSVEEFDNANTLLIFAPSWHFR